MLRKNDEIQLKIDAFSSEGSGIGHFEGMAVFVDGAAAGDTVVAHIIKVKSSYAVGKLVRVVNPSPDRISSDCEVSASCGGCAFRQISYEAEVSMKREKVESALKRIGGIEKKLDGFIAADTLVGYRNKAQYPVCFDNGVKIGFYALHTHRIVDCANCLLQPEIFADIVSEIRKWIVECGIEPYDPQTGNGLIRHIYLRQGMVTGEIMVCLVVNAESIPKEKQLITRLAEFENIRSIVLNINTDSTNVVLSKKCVTLYGGDYIHDELCGVKIRLSPLSFYQVNHDQAEKLYKKAAEYAALDGSQTVVDMYCGAGTIGLSMAHNAKSIIGVEIVAPAVGDAKVNAELNGIKNAEFYCMDASQAAEMLADKGVKPDVIILDPPRKGCAEELVETVGEMNPDRIVYVSCDPATLARDCKRFSQFGYNVEKLTAVDLFPRTVHVESVALLIKNECDRTQIERITEYEKMMDEAKEMIASGRTDKRLDGLVRTLERYYTGDEWKRDYADDEAGKLPAHLKRGVLSQDGISNLLDDYADLKKLVILETERLILRAWDESDASECYKYASDERVGPSCGWPVHTSVEQSRQVIRDILAVPETYAIVLKETGLPVGSIGLHHTEIAKGDDEVELGFWLGVPYWGRSIVPEAGREVLRHAFEDLGLRRVWCVYHEGNEKSKRAQEKLGFVRQRTGQSVYLGQLGETRKVSVNLLTKEDWLARRKSETD